MVLSSPYSYNNASVAVSEELMTASEIHMQPTTRNGRIIAQKVFRIYTENMIASACGKGG